MPDFSRLILAGLTTLSLGAVVPAHAGGWRPIDLQVSPVAAFLPGEGDRFGALEFRGGLVLRSPESEFGGLSGIDFAGDGTTLYGVTDTGFWFSAEIEERDGRLIGLRQPRIAPILGDDGLPVRGKRSGDAEALRVFPAGGGDAALVAFEQGSPLRRFDGPPEFAGAAGVPQPVPAAVRRLSSSQGLEAVAVAPHDGPLAGGTVLIAEHSLDANGNHRGWIVGGPHAGAFAIRRYGAFDVTDAAFLPDGDLLLLERSFGLSEGLAMRLRRIPRDNLRPSRTVDGVFLMAADMAYEIDNMEGLAVHTSADGETLITLVSDDNYNPLQRTVLLQFALAPAPVPRPPLRPPRRRAS